MIRKLLGISPQSSNDGAYIPSRLSLKLATSAVTNYSNQEYENAYCEGNLKILMICTEEQHMTMKNGKKFSTGNHPVEMLVPMLHFKKAGFETEVFTPSGKPVKIELWAMPEKDEFVKEIYEEYKEKFDKPKSLKAFAEKEISGTTEYAAVFIPGGHGAMLGLPENKDVKKVIHWAHHTGLFMLSICHGPAALLAAGIEEKSENFLYRGYKIAAFPDSVDKQSPMIGYMPGSLTWKFGESLKNLGVEIVNKKADKTCFVDRKLITGASPEAADEFGNIAAKEMLSSVKSQ